MSDTVTCPHCSKTVRTDDVHTCSPQAMTCPDCGQSCTPGTLHACPYRGTVQVPHAPGGEPATDPKLAKLLDAYLQAVLDFKWNDPTATRATRDAALAIRVHVADLTRERDEAKARLAWIMAPDHYCVQVEIDGVPGWDAWETDAGYMSHAPTYEEAIDKARLYRRATP